MVMLLFALTLGGAAALSFFVQPLIGKQLLPVLGGSPGVWNSCLVFFQAMLLMGYLLAHGMARLRVPFLMKLIAHAGLLVLAIASLQLLGKLKPDESLIPTTSEMPIIAVLLVLAQTVGLPFLVLSMTAPLLQSWYARLGKDPYPLYAASNLGSFIGLLGYPLLVEPRWPVGDQRDYWIIALVGVAFLILVCGYLARNMRSNSEFLENERSEPPIPRLTIYRWIMLAALPSSLLLSVTNHLTTDIAPVPLLWVVPLSLYLLSFVIVFARWGIRSRRLIGRITPMFLCFLAVALLTRANTPLVLVAGVHLLTFFLVALLCHGELAASRPHASRLTQFYLWLSLGGVLGGLLNTLVAPILFEKLGPIEYPIAIVLAGLVRPPMKDVGVQFKPMDGIWPFALAIFTTILVVGVPMLFPSQTSTEEEDVLNRLIRGGLSFGIPAAFAFALVWRPIRFTLCLAVLMIIGSFSPNPHGTILETHRNYFGTLRVTQSADGRFHRIVHGTTLHGQQLWPVEGRPEPATYYHRKGPFGRLMEKLPVERRKRVGVVGLGCGATAAYANQGQHWTFFEIDPAVVRLAEDPRYFTFLSECPPVYDIVLGDARRQLRTVHDREFDLLVLDAFSSDAVPIHLLTKEAFELYLAKIKDDGVLALHLSNRYLDLPPIVERALHAIDPELTIRYDNDEPTEENKLNGQTGSTWVFVARRAESLGAADARWPELPRTTGVIWTDDFSNLLSAWRTDD